MTVDREAVDRVLDLLQCRFGCDEPVQQLVYAPAGCFCWTDPVQALCWQHSDKMQSAGPITVLAERPLTITRKAPEGASQGRG